MKLIPCQWCNSTPTLRTIELAEQKHFNGYMVAECIDKFHRNQVFGNSKDDVVTKWNQRIEDFPVLWGGIDG